MMTPFPSRYPVQDRDLGEEARLAKTGSPTALAPAQEIRRYNYQQAGWQNRVRRVEQKASPPLSWAFPGRC
jgi:hypothetical protein